MTEKEKLVKLMKEAEYPVFPNSDIMLDLGVQHPDHVFESVARHLLANGVTVLPCKPGDTIYATHWFAGFAGARWELQEQAVSGVVQYISFLKDGEVLLHLKDAAIPARYFGEYLFATREEALAALARRQTEREKDGGSHE